MSFADRHIGPDEHEQTEMLEALGLSSLDDLVDAVVPASIREQRRLSLPDAAGEVDALEELRALAARNVVRTSMIGLGYHDTITPPVVLRNVLENPSWYTAYTPYQPEISQGRLEALLNFQTVIEDLSGLPVANASLLDEGTAAAEAMALCYRAGAKVHGTFVVDADCLPQTIDVLRGRAEPMGYDVAVHDVSGGTLPDGDITGVLLQYPGASGRVRDDETLIAAAHDRGALVAVAADLLGLVLLRAPGAIGADVVVGSAQRFGVPMGFGGPHAGFMAVRSGLERNLPGRLVGVSIDADGNPAHRLALQTREQHIRRERATSNICTAQVLLAVIASMYAVHHGPDGLRRIATTVHRRARTLAVGLGDLVVHRSFFDTVLAHVPGRATAVVAGARARGVLLRRVDDDHVAIACDERTTRADLEAVWAAFDVDAVRDVDGDDLLVPRTDEILVHPVFRTHRSETSMLRYLKKLSDRDYALDRGMIPLGSCTMKLNATTEMEPITWPEMARIHPFAPADDVEGYTTLIDQLEAWLAEITGYDAVSVQPNAGSQGELAGLLAIRSFHLANGDDHRDVCLIPSSAHGTNAASAAMAGMRVVVVACDAEGNVDLDDLRSKVEAHRDVLSALMITYPSTHGVFEEEIGEICDAVHDAGGQVYVDGANLNALVGLAKPGRFGGDVSHLNLHKTFCIPHGGGGPGVGPVAVRAHLTPHLPRNISSAPYGSASILPISWAYIRMMGPDGLADATRVAILSANYIAHRLRDAFPVLYAGRNGFVAHECILDLRPITRSTGVTVEDVAKRLIDYGFHAPTMSFPVAGTLMVEPTESEDLAELDRFCDAMLAIRAEIDAVPDVLRNAPHTASMLLAEDWPHPYTREQAAYPVPSVRANKYWPPVRRIDQAHGDRNLVCSCPPVEAYA